MSTKITLGILLTLSVGLFCVFYFTRPSNVVNSNSAKAIPATTVVPYQPVPSISTSSAPVPSSTNDAKIVPDENDRIGHPKRLNPTPVGPVETVH